MSDFYDEPLCGSVTLDNLGTSAWLKYKGVPEFRKFWWGHGYVLDLILISPFGWSGVNKSAKIMVGTSSHVPIPSDGPSM